jgi:hypothetical protein
MFNPTSIEGTLFLGIIAGILTSGLIFVSGLMVKQILVPWYQRVIYRGIDLSGNWEQVFQRTGATYRFDIRLRQSGHRLVGTLTKSKSGTKDDYVHVFNCSGWISDGFVILNLESADKSSLSLGTTLLKVYETGERLKGLLAHRGRQTDEIENEIPDWKRKR